MKFDKNNIIVSLTKQNGEWQVNGGNENMRAKIMPFIG